MSYDMIIYIPSCFARTKIAYFNPPSSFFIFLFFFLLKSILGGAKASLQGDTPRYNFPRKYVWSLRTINSHEFGIYTYLPLSRTSAIFQTSYRLSDPI